MLAEPHLSIAPRAIFHYACATGLRKELSSRAPSTVASNGERGREGRNWVNRGLWKKLLVIDKGDGGLLFSIKTRPIQSRPSIRHG